MKSRTIFIGDIHGCFDEFQLLLKKIKISKKDMVYIVGDMINKGPDSWKVIKYLYENQTQFHAIKGNHELGLIDWLNGYKPEYGNENYIKLKTKFEKHPKIYDYFKNLPLYIDNQDFLMIHGGLVPNKELHNHSADEITNIREIDGLPWYTLINSDKKVIYGHWAMNGLNIYNNTVGLDGGCVYGRALHAYILESGNIVTQQALKCYVDVFKKD